MTSESSRASGFVGRKFTLGNGPLATVRRINDYFDDADSISQALADLVGLFDNMKFREYSPDEDDEYIIEETRLTAKPNDTFKAIKQSFQLLNHTLNKSDAYSRFSRREGAIFLVDHLLTCQTPNFPTMMGMLNMRKKQKFHKDFPVNKPNNCIRLQPEMKKDPRKDLRELRKEAGDLPLFMSLEIMPRSITKKEEDMEITMIPGKLNGKGSRSENLTRRRPKNPPLKQIPDKANHQRKRASGEKAAERISVINRSKKVKLKKKLKLPAGISSRKFRRMRQCSVVIERLDPKKYKNLLLN
ncbi:Oidioi.mRNA.OKI2018_I69.PAR.g11198.t1.cds [Oikopleura dioica]|uniref:Oidioi.mRNA.OKI2018_I69.PAR.g11198.t1.cds n=1 Tax=Oikopleura dioica TaxID=34765 RepID=A0ABN7RUK8_OIKDI|nr:Oidioi.mRNA.OKI2018_I69.PAR.g11198.t1.cds [Oikopleura dioica]